MLSDATRLRILWCLHRDEQSVGQLAIALDKAPASVSQHLAKLRLARLVQTHRGDHLHEHGEHGHDHRGGLRGFVLSFFRPHSHDAADSIDSALESSAEGIRALKVSLVVLLATAAAQLVVVIFTGSVPLLADTIHNLSDALAAVPLWIAFVLVRRAPTKRYTYGLAGPKKSPASSSC